MSEKSSGNAHVPKAIDTLVGAGMRIEGDIACTGLLRVQGEILGNVSCHESPAATLMVDSAGNITGTVRASRVIARGRIVGPVRSSQSIEIHHGGAIAGDVSYREIAIHPGGVVDGSLSPVVAADTGEPAGRPTAQAADAADAAGTAEAAPASPGLRGLRATVVAVAIAATVGVGIWINAHPELVAASDDGAAPEATSRTPETPPRAAPAPENAKTAAPDATPAPPVPPAAATDAAQSAAAGADENVENGVVSVRGINPSRPAGVFLLVSNEPVLLFRKKNGEAGEGARISIPAGEKVSVSIAADELIRVAQGRDVVILYQGKKVSRGVIDSGAWISFVPK